MGKTNKEQKQSYLNAIYQNASTGAQAIADILDKVEDEELKQEILREKALYDDIKAEIEEFAATAKLEVKDNNFFEKSRLWMSINMGTMMNSTPRKIAELMLIGSVMGLITCYKDKHDHKNVSQELDLIIERLEKIEDDNYKELKKYLNK